MPVHVLHRLATVCAAVVGPAVVAVHLPATGAPLRVVLALLAAITWTRPEPGTIRGWPRVCRAARGRGDGPGARG